MVTNQWPGDFMFGVGYGRVSKRRERALIRIAKKHGAEFIAAELPEGPRYWFKCPNHGQPIDSERATAVINEAEKLELWPPNRKKGE